MLLGWIGFLPMILLNSHVTSSCISHATSSCISHAYVLSFLSYSELLSLSLSLSFRQTARWHLNSVNPLRLGTLFKVLGLLLLILPSPSTFGSVMRRLERTSLRTSSSIGMLGYFVELCRHSSIRSHSDLGLGIST